MAGRFSKNRPFADPAKAARRLIEHAMAFQPPLDGWIDIEQLNHPFLFGDKASLAEFRAGMEYALSRSWLELHESGMLVRLIEFGAGVSREANFAPDTDY
jgi:hypothetical protein